MFLPTPGEGAVGALDWPDDERRRLAKESVKWCCPKCGNAKALLPELHPKEGEKENKNKKKNPYAEQVAQLHMHTKRRCFFYARAPTAKHLFRKAAGVTTEMYMLGKHKRNASKRETQSEDRATRREENKKTRCCSPSLSCWHWL